jgi:ubiquinone biosynthesis accessory factor UbiK
MISTLAKQLFDDVAQHLPKSANDLSFIFSEQGSEAFNQFKVHVEASLRKMNLVSRDEFDAQTAVLQKTRERLEVLEQEVKVLEERFQKHI